MQFGRCVLTFSQDPAANSETSVLFSRLHRVMLEHSSLRGNYLDQGTSDIVRLTDAEELISPLL